MSDYDEINEENQTVPQNEGETYPHTDSEITPPPDDDPDEEVKEKGKKLIKVPLFAAVIGALALAILTAQITFLAVRLNYHRKLATIDTGKDQMTESTDTGTGTSSININEKLSEVDKLYRKYYVNDIDDEDVMYGLIVGYIYGVGDVYGSYLTAEEYEDYNNSLNAKTKGIGASVIWNPDMYAIEVTYVYEDSPAEKAGVLAGDIITEVDGVPVSELGYDDGVSAVKGEEGTTVTLTVLRGKDYSEEVKIVSERGEIKVKTVFYKQYGEIAVISITNFYSSTPYELKETVAKATADGCDRIVFDVRNNPGGYLTSVLDVLDYILPEGVVLKTRNANDEWKEYKSDESCLQMPMVVIVNGNTASAAELFTSALKDYGYATVIGTTTFGKGTVLEPFTLSDGSVIYISTELYYPPVSDNFEGVGITPDETVELDEQAKKTSFYKLTYETDNQLQRAVEIIKEK